MRSSLPWMFVLLAGCNANPDLSSVRDAVEIGGALGLSAQLALDAIPGTTTSSACVAVTTACTSFPCTGAATIMLGAGCALPFGDAATGQILVTASFTSADSASVSSTFVDARAGAQTLAVVSAKQLTITRAGAGSTVSYVGQDVTTASVATLASQSSWTVTIDDQGTDDPADDRYQIDGTDQTVAGLNVDQISVSGAALDPSCRLNPVAGSATLQHVAGFDIEQDSITFHAACDGRAVVAGRAVPF